MRDIIRKTDLQSREVVYHGIRMRPIHEQVEIGLQIAFVEELAEHEP
jgi:hypothetical protein